MKKKVLVMGAVLAMVMGSTVGCGNSIKAVDIPKLEAKDTAKVEKKTYSFADGYAVVASNSKYELIMDKNFGELQVKQLSTGAVWSSAVADSKKLADKAPMSVSYFAADAKELIPASKMLNDFSDKEAMAIKDEKGKEIGVRVSYSDSKLKLTIAVDYYLTDEGFAVRLPAGGVKEEGSYQLISVDILPNMALASNKEEGYYLYPDGCGAIMEFKDASHYGESTVSYPVYGDVQQYKNMLGEWDERGVDVFLPIFGAKVGDQSFLAVIEQGEETAKVQISPAAAEGNNKLWCTFLFRNSFIDKRADKDGQLIEKNRFDKDLTDVERVVSYRLFEAKEDVTYSEMAVKYREYLIASGVEKKEKEDSIPVSLDIFMGINEEGTITDSFKSVTTFSEAEKMVDQLLGNEVKDLDVQLKGWTKNGYFTDPTQFPVNSQIGGNSALKSFTDKFKEDKNVKITLETNLLEAKANVNGYDVNKEIVISGNYNPITDAQSKKYLLSPNVVAGNMNRLFDDVKSSKAAIDGFSFYSLGQYVTYNYSSDNTLTKSQCKKIWQDMLAKADKEYDKVIVQGGNQYALQYADKVTNIPYADSGYRITTDSVPVYQIAVHGLVNYTGSAGNLSSDLNGEKLKWVEYGYVPYFELTYNGSEELMHTEYSQLFSSTFSAWLDEATAIYKDYNKNLKDVWNAYIVDHEEVSDGVYKVTYDNNKVVYVNYNDKEAKVDENVVEANSYLVK